MKIAIVEDNKVLAILLKERLETILEGKITIDLFFSFEDFKKNCNIYNYKFFIIDIILQSNYDTGIDVATMIKGIYKTQFGVYLTGCMEQTNHYIRAMQDVRNGYIYEVIIKTEDIKSIISKLVYYIKLQMKEEENGR